MTKIKQAETNQTDRKEQSVSCFINREISWLKFNERVLEEAADITVPLCERLNFISIFQKNLEEFFMIRVGSLQDQTLLKEPVYDNKTNMTSMEQIKAAIELTTKLCIQRDVIYEELMEVISKHGFRIVRFMELTEKEAQGIEAYFDTEIAPLLSPMIVGKKQSFPFMANGLVYAVVVMETLRGKEKIGIIPCGSNLFEQLVAVSGNPGTFMLVEEVILHFVNKIFDQYNIKGKSLVKLTRNADINVDSLNDEDLDYRDLMAEAVKMRKKLAPVRLELTRELDKTVVQVLCYQLGLSKSQVFLSKVPLDMDFVSVVRDALRDKPELFYAKHTPVWPALVDRNNGMMEQIDRQDMLLFYPYESIRPFLNLLHEAACDPTVISIKMTLYRLAKQSKVVEALIEAAENGKEIVVLVELKARFDEENNIEWSRRLENAGCQVIYGVDGVKVHSKLCLITRRIDRKLTYITQFGTGNYNEKTSEFYTDFTFMTGDMAIGSEAAQLFLSLGLNEIAKPQKHLLVAPNGLQNRILELIDEQIELAKADKKAYIGLKLNSLTDIMLMKKLIEASQNGVKIDMIIRGICCLIPGIPGLTEHINIISIVGRFLEHSRVYIFGSENEKIYIGSADWMTRNTLKRIEVAVPIYDTALKRRLKETFTVMICDNTKTRKLNALGMYERITDGKIKLNAQEFFAKNN